MCIRTLDTHYNAFNCTCFNIILSQEIEPTCAADLCTLWQNCENPEDHTPVITSRRRKNSENAARYPPPTSSHPRVTSSHLRVTSCPSFHSGLASKIIRWLYSYLSFSIMRTYSIMSQGQSCKARTIIIKHSYKHLLKIGTIFIK